MILQYIKSQRAVLPLLGVIFFIGCSKPEWKNLEYPEYHFSVSMPDNPKESITELPSDGLDLKNHNFVYKTGEVAPEFTSYSVFFADLKGNASSDDSLSVKNYFEDIDRGILSLAPDTVLYEKRLTFHGYPAKEVCIAFGDVYQIATQMMILVGDKSYTVQMIYPAHKKDLPDHKKFWNSFKLLDAPH